MKLDWNPKYTTIAVYACIVIAFTVMCIFAGIYFDGILNFFNKLLDTLAPIIYGFVIAYMLNPMLKLFEHKVFAFVEKKKNRKKLNRSLSLISTYLVFAIIITLFIMLIVPQITTSYMDLVSKLNYYVTTAQEWIDRLNSSSPFFNAIYTHLMHIFDIEKLTDILNSIISDSVKLLQQYAPAALSVAKVIVNQLKNLVIGIFMSIYFLMSKEMLLSQIKKLLNSLFAPNRVERILDNARFTDRTFGAYIAGTLLDACFVGLISFIFLGLFNFPYYPIISLILAITNMIPFFGPFLGAIPSAIIILIASPGMTLWFVIFVVAMQQIDGNIIAPRIIGETTGIPPVYVIIAITLMSGLFGIIGMFIGVPIFAIIYALVKRFAEARLKAKQMPTETAKY